MTSASILELTMAGGLIAIASAFTLWMIARPERVDLFGIAFFVTAAMPGAGCFLAYFYGADLDLKVGVTAVVFGYMSIYCFLIGMLLFRFFIWRPREHYMRLLIDTANNRPPMSLFLFFIACWTTRLILAFGYGAFFSGTNDLAQGVPLGILPFERTFNYVSFGLVFWCVAHLFTTKGCSLSGWLLLLPEVFYLFACGRRWMLAFGMAIFLIYAARQVKLRIRTLVFGGIIGITTILVLMPFFQATRYLLGGVSRYSSSNQFVNIIHAMGEAYKGLWVQKSETLIEMHEGSMKHRTRITNLNVDIADELSNHGPMWGESLLRDFHRIFIPRTGGLAGEQSIQDHFEWKLKDISSNWPAYGLADFNLPGCVVYGAFFCGLISIFEVLILRTYHKHPMFAMFILGVGYYGVAFFDVPPGRILSCLRALIGLTVFSLPFLFISASNHESGSIASPK